MKKIATLQSLTFFIIAFCLFSVKTNSFGNNLTLAAATTADIATTDNCNCNGNELLNSSFESYKQVKDVWVPTDWKYEGNFTLDNAYDVCGNYNGLLSGSGSFSQESANVVPGSKVTLNIYGGYHAFANHYFKLIFLGAGGEELLVVKQKLDKSLSENGNKLKKYTLIGTAPEGTLKVKVLGTATGNWFKVDVACLNIEQPAYVCNDCEDNKLKNPSFEETKSSDGKEVPKEWTGNRFVKDGAYVVCGSKSGLINSGAGSFYQDVEALAGSKVTLKIWGGYHNKRNHKFELQFFAKGGSEPISSVSVELDKSVEELKGRLKQYKIDALSPVGTAFVRVVGSSTGDFFKVDAACLTIFGGSLPVKLVGFKAAKSENSVKLAWSTASESNSRSFEIQQSVTGNNWQTLGEVAAKGESSATANYDFVHNTPASGNNLYRLKMIDADNTFAYSSIVSVKFEGTSEIALYPNPATDYMTVKSSGATLSNVKIYNTSGVLVKNAAPDASNKIQLGDLKSGRYIVKINDISGAVTTKHIVVVK
ncbi:T9SS type A sorting domain-containing protein [Dyadobacter sp. CY312]|uniref:T9SS type A sorting domain-containing protein n=1 Tax=Dyadobacter sp. CY312 TaxID=2907303 RepID=UPI001F2BECBB|nr:T9SS type A sorting domain-containing protein [Dyadobacter sp. CY312]MCE7040646.1 T9SS type A sorting domain-containing protein [Dyadobacter sp. CY312]